MSIFAQNPFLHPPPSTSTSTSTSTSPPPSPSATEHISSTSISASSPVKVPSKHSTDLGRERGQERNRDQDKNQERHHVIGNEYQQHHQPEADTPFHDTDETDEFDSDFLLSTSSSRRSSRGIGGVGSNPKGGFGGGAPLKAFSSIENQHHSSSDLSEGNGNVNGKGSGNRHGVPKGGSDGNHYINPDRINSLLQHLRAKSSSASSSTSQEEDLYEPDSEEGSSRFASSYLSSVSVAAGLPSCSTFIAYLPCCFRSQISRSPLAPVRPDLHLLI